MLFRKIGLLIISAIIAMPAAAEDPAPTLPANSCLSDRELDEVLARNTCKWGIEFGACSLAVASGAAAIGGASYLLTKLANERAASQAAQRNRTHFEDTMNEYMEWTKREVTRDRTAERATQQMNANNEEIRKLRAQIDELGGEERLGHNSRALLRSVNDLNQKNAALEAVREQADNLSTSASVLRRGAMQDLDRRLPSNIPVFTDDEPFKEFHNDIAKFKKMLAEEADLAEREKAVSVTKKAGYESKELADIRREKSNVEAQLESQRAKLYSSRQGYEQMMHLRAGASGPVVVGVLGAMAGGGAAYGLMELRHRGKCQSAFISIEDPEIKDFFNVDNSCHIQLKPEKMGDPHDMDFSKVKEQLSKPKFCSVLRKHLTEIRGDQKFAQLDPEATNCEYPRMIHYEADGHKFVNKIEKLGNGSFRMTGSFFPDSPLSNDQKDPGMFQVLIDKGKPGNVTSRNDNWRAQDIGQWSVLSTRGTKIENSADDGYPKPEDRGSLGRPVTGLTPKLQQSVDRQWRAIQETEMSVGVGCASGTIGNTRAPAAPVVSDGNTGAKREGGN